MFKKSISTAEANGIRSTLNDMPVGSTKVVRGVVVTRWSQFAFETDTWGKNFHHDSMSIALSILKRD